MSPEWTKHGEGEHFPSLCLNQTHTRMTTPNIQKFRDEAFSNEYLTKLIEVDSNCTDLEFIQSVMNSDMNGAIGFQDRVSKAVIKHVLGELNKVN